MIRININVMKGAVTIKEKLGYDISPTLYMHTIIQLLIEADVEAIYTISIFR